MKDFHFLGPEGQCTRRMCISRQDEILETSVGSNCFVDAHMEH